MEIQFLTLLDNNNDWLDWAELWFGGEADLDRPKEFPCYAANECVAYLDKDVEGDGQGDACFWPTFLYANDLQDMLDKL